MSVRWHDDIAYLVALVVLLAVTGVVYVVLKKRQPNEGDGAVFAKAAKWVEGVFITLLIGGLIIVTIRYS